MPNRLPPLNALRVFNVAACSQSFSQAAQQLCLTQGAVSRQIQLLERFFGFALFVRHPRQHLILTPEAQILAPAVRECFAKLEDTTRRLTHRNAVLSLKIPTCAMRWVLPRVMHFRAIEPGTEVQLTTTFSHRVDFTSEPFDAAIVYGEAAASAHADHTPLFAEVLTPVCAPALLKEQSIRTPDDLAKHTLLHPTRDHADWHRWLHAAGASHMDADQGQSFETMDLAMDAAARGFGVAIGDCTLMADDVAAGRLACPFDLRLATGQHYHLVLPERGVNAQRLLRFRDWMVERSRLDTAPPSPASNPQE